jgi:dTDP-4-amino-4,6-dideoxygalactose transaminase
MISQNDFQRRWLAIEQPVLNTLRRVGKSGRYILGEEVQAFEAALALSWGIEHAVGVANGMDAIEIGLRCLGLCHGDKVLTTPLSAFATTLAIIRAGGVPVFVDVDEAGGINLGQCRELLKQDPEIRHFVPVHLYGHALDMNELKKLKDDFDLSIVEDCAQAIGASRRGISVGTVGQLAATSFYPTKNLGALGDGGAVLTDNEEVAAKARVLRNYGQSAHYVHDELGSNSRLDELHAAILRDAMLPNLEAWTALKRKTARLYLDAIRNPLIQMCPSSTSADPVWHLFPILVGEGMRDSLREHLRDMGIDAAIHYPRIIPEQQALTKNTRFEVQFDPTNARRFAAEELSLPIHPFLIETEIREVIDACNKWEPRTNSNSRVRTSSYRTAFRNSS